MLQVFQFIFNCVAAFIAMLFTIDVGNGTNLGVIMCIIYILLPVLLSIVNFLKNGLLEELDERYDESKPRNIISSTLTENRNLGNGKRYTYTNTVRYNRRFRKK